jgi:hypothetical protein
MLPPCSSSPRKPPPRSAPPMSKRASCRPPSRCAACSPGSPTTPRRGHAPRPSLAGNHCPRRLVRLPRYAFVGADPNRRSHDQTRTNRGGATTAKRPGNAPSLSCRSNREADLALKRGLRALLVSLTARLRRVDELLLILEIAGGAFFLSFLLLLRSGLEHYR